MNDKNSQIDADSIKENETTKKTYETPELSVHGTVAQITEFIGPNAGDGIIGSQVIISDRDMKHEFAAIDKQDVLARLVALPVEKWSYNFQSTAVRHIGPMAQDFAAAFGIGEDNKSINVVDANGVTIAAIQALHSMIQQRDDQLAEMRSEIELLKKNIVH